MRLYYIFSLVLLFNVFSLKAQHTDAMLFGDVKSGKNHIPFATIAIKGTTIGTAADATGHFKMTDIPLGEQVVVISAVGFKSTEQTHIFEMGKSITLSIELAPDNIGLEQVVVSADRSARSRKDAGTIVNSIGAKLMDRTQNVNMSDGLNFSPGLRLENNCQSCGFSQVRMNGMESYYTQILVNSRPVFSSLAGVYGIELIPANMIDRVEVIRGGGSAMYGSNAIAGTINLITKDPLSNTFSIGSSAGNVGTGIENTNPAGDYSINFNGSFVTDDYKSGLSIFGFHRKRGSVDLNNDGFSDMTYMNNTTIGARFYQRVANRGKLTGDYFNINEFRRGGDGFDLLPHEAMIAEVVRHQINSGAINFDLLARENDKFSAYFSAQKVDRESYYGANQDPAAYGFTKDFTYSAGVQYARNFELLFDSPSILIAGIENNGSNLKDTKLGYFDPVQDIHLGNTEVAHQKMITNAAFLQNEWTLNKAVFTAGLRFDHYTIADKLNFTPDLVGNVFSPRLNLLYHLSETIQARLGYAGGFRAPQILDEDLHIEASGARKVIHKNDPGLKQETSKSFTFSLDFDKQFGKWQTEFLAEAFYTKLLNPFANKYGTPDENGTVIYTRVNAEDGAIVQGVNLEFNAAPSALFQVQSGFTIQKTAYESPQEFNETRFFRSPNNYGFLSLNYIPVPRLNISATANYTGSMLVPYFGSSLSNPEQGELRESATFMDAGFKMAYEIKISDHILMEINAGIKNIFNAYQQDLDSGINRDPSYIYGPTAPRTIYFGVKFGNLL